MKKITLLMLSLWANIVMIAQPSFTETTIDGSFNDAYDVFAIDMDGDGDMDVIGAAISTNEITWWENDGSQSFTEHTISSGFTTTRSIYAIDLDEDGDIDVLGAGGSNNEISWWENNGSQSFTEHSIDNSFNDAWDIMAIDVDSDNDIDVVSVSWSGNEIAWWDNDGSENFTKKSIGTPNRPWSLDAADVDGDNDMDILSASQTDDEVVWWENDGSQSFTKRVINSAVFDDARGVHAVDLDRDGDMDVLGAASTAQDIVWWENDGSQSFTKHNIKTDFNGAVDVYATDMDGDGDLDVLGSAWADADIIWWENNGSQSFTEHTVDANFSRAYNVFAADVDSDGDMDILGAADSDADITWWKSDLANQTLDFDGTDDYVSLGAMDELDNLSQFTAMGWFYFDGVASGMRLITNKATSGTTSGWGITLGGGSTGDADDVKFNHDIDGSSDGDVYTSGLGLATNKWYHIAVVFDGTQATATDRVSIYVNGQLQTNNFLDANPPSTLPSSAANLHLGAKTDVSDKFFQGNMDEVSFWRTALSETAIQDMMHTMITDTTNLEAYYRFHVEAGAPTFADYSGKDHVGTWNGSGGGTNTTSTLETETYPFTYSRINNIRGVWRTLGTSDALISDGLRISAFSTPTGVSRAIWGHDNAGTGTTTADLSSASATTRLSQTWKVELINSLSGNFSFFLNTISGTTVTAGTASDYVLLWRVGTSGDFFDAVTATNVDGDRVDFSSVALSGLYFTLGTKDAASSPILPVEMLSFTGKLQENNVLLEWETAVEINNSHFDVEFSTDGFDFIKIGEVKGAGTTNEAQEYGFVHDFNRVGFENRHSLDYYYRIKQVDFDGKYEYTDILNITIEQSSNPTINIFPNPATDFLIIENAQAGDIIQIFNTNHQLVKTIQYNSSTTQVSINELSAGTYYIGIADTIQRLIIIK